MSDSSMSEQTPPCAAVDTAFAVALRGFGPAGLLAILVIFSGNFLFAPLSALLVLWWRQLSDTPWVAIGYVRPRSWIGGMLLGIALGVVLKLGLKVLVMPLLGAPPINAAYHYLAANTSAALLAIPELIIKAGFGEETLFRGFLFERLGRLLGQRLWARVLIVLSTSLFFGVMHYPEQGLAGAQQATLVGLVFGTIYLRSGRIWMLMCAHAAFDLTALAIIYGQFELELASWAGW